MQNAKSTPSVNIQPADVIKVPVALNGGVVLAQAPNPAVGGCVVTLHSHRVHCKVVSQQYLLIPQ